MNNDIKHLPNGDCEVVYDTPVYIGVDLAQGNDKTVTSWVGYCQRCGMLDHHLEHELCPLCLKITPMHEEVDDRECSRPVI